MEETKTQQSDVKGSESLDDNLLNQFLGEEAAHLMGILRSYVFKYELTDKKEEIQEIALELLHEIYIEAAKSHKRFDPTHPPRAWLLGIARNLVMRKRTAMIERKYHEDLMCDLVQQRQEQEGDEDHLERLFTKTGPRLEQQVEANDTIEYYLSRVSKEYQYVLHLWYMEDLSAEEIAERLGCNRNSTLVRLHRARKQLRAAITNEKGERNG
jgi:RNA polymerase sigma factor (sigma-70 family)